jgi:hypothetical protein
MPRKSYHMKIEAGKLYRTRDGNKAMILATDVPDPRYPVQGYVRLPDAVDGSPRCYPMSWDADGFYLQGGGSTGSHGCDLVEPWLELEAVRSPAVSGAYEVRPRAGGLRRARFYDQHPDPKRAANEELQRINNGYYN